MFHLLTITIQNSRCFHNLGNFPGHKYIVNDVTLVKEFLLWTYSFYFFFVFLESWEVILRHCSQHLIPCIRLNLLFFSELILGFPAPSVPLHFLFQWSSLLFCVEVDVSVSAETPLIIYYTTNCQPSANVNHWQYTSEQCLKHSKGTSSLKAMGLDGLLLLLF